MKAIIGIDPGKSGGMTLLRDVGVEHARLDGTERDIFAVLFEWSVYNPFAFVERVCAIQAAGVVSSFKFGQSFGFLRGILIAMRVPFELVAPPVWQRDMKCLSKGDKRVTRARAQELFPDEKVAHWNADCLLIAEWGRRFGKGFVARDVRKDTDQELPST